MVTEFTRLSFDQNKMASKYCLEDTKDMYLQGTRDDISRKQAHSYFIIRVSECTDATKFDGDPVCSSQTQIDDYLNGKVLQLYSTKKTVNFKIDSSNPEYYKESYAFLNGINLGKNKFTDAGYRFKLNRYYSTEDFFMGQAKTIDFYTIETFNQVEFEVRKVDMNVITGFIITCG